MEIKKIVVLSSILSLLETMVVPTAQAFASQTQSESSFQENEGYFLDGRNCSRIWNSRFIRF